MVIPCPSCQSPIDLKSAPVRGHANDGSEAWICLKCPAIICIDCYHEHSKKQHSEMASEIKKPKK